ncbi:MAG: hypothetical protein AB1726_03420, partial [Planctomycetota bacterium]
MGDREGTGWREAPRRAAAGGRPAGVTALVDQLHLGLSAARWGESVLVGAGALLTTLAAAAAGPAGGGRGEILAVALLGGLFAAATWRLAHRIDARSIARRLDRRLRHHGALFTAWEAEKMREDSPLVRLLCARVLERLRMGEAVRAIAPPLAAPLAAPLLGALLFALALDARPASPAGRGREPVGFDEALAGLAPAAFEAWDAGTADEATVRAVAAVQSRLRALEAELGRPAADPALLRAEVEAADRELVRLDARAVADPHLRERLAAVRPHLDAARMGLGEESAGSAAAAGGEGGGAGAGPAAGPSAARPA